MQRRAICLISTDVFINIGSARQIQTQSKNRKDFGSEPSKTQNAETQGRKELDSTGALNGLLLFLTVIIGLGA
jgi:hypothetical protein